MFLKDIYLLLISIINEELLDHTHQMVELVLQFQCNAHHEASVQHNCYGNIVNYPSINYSTSTDMHPSDTCIHNNYWRRLSHIEIITLITMCTCSDCGHASQNRLIQLGCTASILVLEFGSETSFEVYICEIFYS